MPRHHKFAISRSVGRRSTRSTCAFCSPLAELPSPFYPDPLRPLVTEISHPIGINSPQFPDFPVGRHEICTVDDCPSMCSRRGSLSFLPRTPNTGGCGDIVPHRPSHTLGGSGAASPRRITDAGRPPGPVDEKLKFRVSSRKSLRRLCAAREGGGGPHGSCFPPPSHLANPSQVWRGLPISRPEIAKFGGRSGSRCPRRPKLENLGEIKNFASDKLPGNVRPHQQTLPRVSAISRSRDMAPPRAADLAGR